MTKMGQIETITPHVISGSGSNSLLISPSACQNHVQTEACGAERPFWSWEEHPAEEAHEGTRGRLRIQCVTYVHDGPTWPLWRGCPVWGRSRTESTVSSLRPFRAGTCHPSIQFSLVSSSQIQPGILGPGRKTAKVQLLTSCCYLPPYTEPLVDANTRHRATFHSYFYVTNPSSLAKPKPQLFLLQVICTNGSSSFFFFFFFLLALCWQFPSPM